MVLINLVLKLCSFTCIVNMDIDCVTGGLANISRKNETRGKVNIFARKGVSQERCNYGLIYLSN